MAYILESHRQKGYGNSLSTAFNKRLAENGDDLTVSIFFDNKISARMAEKGGFKKVHEDCRFKVVSINKSKL